MAIQKSTRWMILSAALLIQGCETFQHPAQRNAEIAWQAINLIDAGQTVTIARRPFSYSESGLAHLAIGRQPTERKTEEFFAISALAHYAISDWLARQADSTGRAGWQTALRAWYVLTIGYSAYNVGRNASMGIPVFGSSRSAPEPAPTYCPQCRAIGSGPP